MTLPPRGIVSFVKSSFHDIISEPVLKSLPAAQLIFDKVFALHQRLGNSVSGDKGELKTFLKNDHRGQISLMCI